MTHPRLLVTFIALVVCETVRRAFVPVAMVSRDADRLAGHREQGR
jgi:hypothetical protein